MSKHIYINTNKIKAENDFFFRFINEAIKYDYKSFLLYGNIENINRYLNLVKQIINIECSFFLKLAAEEINICLSVIKELNKVKGIIAEFNLENINHDNNVFSILNDINKLCKRIGVSLRYKKNNGIQKLDNFLNIIKNNKIDDLIIESDVEYMENEDNEDFIELFVKYKDFLKKINFYCSFIPELRPKKCVFLEIGSPIIVFNDKSFTICPYININTFNNKKINYRNMEINKLFDYINELESIKKEILKNRYKKYAIKGLDFHCRECMKEFYELNLS